jgi:hypothetical protein
MRDGADLAAERTCKEQWDKKEIVKIEDGGVGRAGIVIGCSALKKWYRDILRGNVDAIPPPTDDLVRRFAMLRSLPYSAIPAYSPAQGGRAKFPS